MKKLLLVAAFLSLQACKTVDKIPNSTIKFVESSGKVEVEMTKKGEWVKIKSSGSASTISSKSLEESMNIATLRAKANLVEFLENDIKSSKSTETILNSLTEDKTDTKLATKAAESISSDAKGIIKGAYVSERKISEDEKYVMVTVIVDKTIVEAVKKISLK